MSRSTRFSNSEAFTLSDRSLYRWLEQQDDGFRELPDDQEFTRLELTYPRKRLQRFGQKLHSLIKKRRRYAYQTV